QPAAAERPEESGSWRHPHVLPALIAEAERRLSSTVPPGDTELANGATFGDADVTALAWLLLGEEPEPVVNAIVDAHTRRASAEQLGRALALAAALRITRFHVQNDHGDWDVVHHGFTAANGLHQLLARSPSPELLRGVVHGALKVYLDRFLNVPAARLPATTTGNLAELQEC